MLFSWMGLHLQGRYLLNLILAGAGFANGGVGWLCKFEEKRAGLTASDPVAGELRAAATGVGKPVDCGPDDALVVANPGYPAGQERMACLRCYGITLYKPGAATGHPCEEYADVQSTPRCLLYTSDAADE